MENDKKCERHFHFSDKVTYIEHQEITCILYTTDAADE